jgi:membrane protease YdiL (CAAX protease family)
MAGDAPRSAVVAPSSEATSSTALFFAAALGISWLSLLAPVLARLGVIPGPAERIMAAAPLAVFSPMLAAILAARLEPGGAGVRALFRSVRTWRVSFVWYLVALLLPGSCLLAGVAVYGLLGGSGDVRWFYPPDQAQYVVAAFLLPLGEEFGWRGFALPRLQKRMGALKASLVLGVLWGAWHIPMFVASDILSPTTLVILVAFFVPGSVLYTWVYNKTGGSLLLMLIMHLGSHLNNSHRPLPDNVVPVVIHLVALSVVACALVVLDRRAWQSASRQ